MLESKIQTLIRQHLKKEGWFVTKLIACSDNGIPDLLAIKDGRVIFFEVKQKGKNPSPVQKYKIKELIKYGVEAYVVRSVKDVKEKCNTNRQ